MSHKKYDCNHPIITFTKLTFSFSKNFLYLRMRPFRMARKQQNRLLERAGMCSVVISSMKFDNESIWNNPKISVPKMCKIVVSWSLNENVTNDNRCETLAILDTYRQWVPTVVQGLNMLTRDIAHVLI